MPRHLLAATLVLGAVAVGAVGAGATADRLLYIGTYTGPTSRGIYAFRFDDATGRLTPAGLAAETPNPSFLAASADGRTVFAVNETSTFNGEPGGSVTSFSVDAATARLTMTSVQPSRGAAPCHLMLDCTGRTLAVANYSSGTFAVFPVAADGRLSPATAVLANTGSGPNKQRQQEPHAHMVLFDATNRYLLGADLGLDRVLVYRFDAAARTVVPSDPPSAAPPAGAGPRHVAFHPNGRWVFSINELTSTITTFAWNAKDGRLTPDATVSTLPAGFTGNNSTAEIEVHANGRFLYGSNRGHDSIAVFTIATDGRLTLVEHEATRGQTPRNFAIDPGGRWLIAANQGTGTLSVFNIDARTGALTPAGPLAEVGSPVSVLFMP